jgi:hypothetical protein
MQVQGRLLVVFVCRSRMSETKTKTKTKTKRDANVSEYEYEYEYEYGPRPLSSPWQMVMALAALLDFSSTLANRRFFAHPHDREDAPYLRIFGRNVQVPFLTLTQMLVWLDAHSVPLGFLFSVLWCIQAFHHADRRADRALKEFERRQIMADLKAVLRRTSLTMPQIMAMTITANDGAMERCKVLLIYYTSLLVQLLILPIGKWIHYENETKMGQPGRVTHDVDVDVVARLLLVHLQMGGGADILYTCAQWRPPTTGDSRLARVNLRVHLLAGRVQNLLQRNKTGSGICHCQTLRKICLPKSGHKNKTAALATRDAQRDATRMECY